MTMDPLSFSSLRFLWSIRHVKNVCIFACVYQKSGMGHPPDGNKLKTMLRWSLKLWASKHVQNKIEIISKG